MFNFWLHLRRGNKIELERSKFNSIQTNSHQIKKEKKTKQKTPNWTEVKCVWCFPVQASCQFQSQEPIATARCGIITSVTQASIVLIYWANSVTRLQIVCVCIYILLSIDNNICCFYFSPFFLSLSHTHTHCIHHWAK